MPNRFSWQARGRSFIYAWQGMKALFATEHNAWLHAVLTVVALLLAIILHVSKTEALVLIVAAAIVWITELLNTAIEKLADYISPQKHPQIGLVKDLAAAAVLVAAIAALSIGLIIFLPKILLYVQVAK